MATTILSALVDDSDILSNQRVIDMSDEIALLDPETSQFYTMLSRLGSKSAFSGRASVRRSSMPSARPGFVRGQKRGAGADTKFGTRASFDSGAPPSNAARRCAPIQATREAPGGVSVAVVVRGDGGGTYPAFQRMYCCLPFLAYWSSALVSIAPAVIWLSAPWSSVGVKRPSSSGIAQPPIAPSGELRLRWLALQPSSRLSASR